MKNGDDLQFGGLTIRRLDGPVAAKTITLDDHAWVASDSNVMANVFNVAGNASFKIEVLELSTRRHPHGVHINATPASGIGNLKAKYSTLTIGSDNEGLEIGIAHLQSGLLVHNGALYKGSYLHLISGKLEVGPNSKMQVDTLNAQQAKLIVAGAVHVRSLKATGADIQFIGDGQILFDEIDDRSIEVSNPKRLISTAGVDALSYPSSTGNLGQGRNAPSI